MSKEPEHLLRVGVAAKRLGLNPFTVRRWIRAGKIQAVRVGNEARISTTEIDRLLGQERHGLVVLYGRVSGPGQRADLQTQLSRLYEWAERERSGKPAITLSDIGSGLNTERKALVRLMEMVQRDEVEEVVVTYADRLTRFGLDYLTRFFAGYGVHVTVLNAAEDHTPEQELTDDLLAILSSFAGRLYGMRSSKRQALLACAHQVLAGEE
ncbi:MAG: IS607 family transposase [Chloroflexi bacterium]|nr:MAG: IS607 family transposase [Chloroflexota bacterium]